MVPDWKSKKAGERFLAAFDSALNPTKKFEEQLRLLQAAGKSTGEIMAVMGDKLTAALKEQRRTGNLYPPCSRAL